jgi:hypothetical protein
MRFQINKRKPAFLMIPLAFMIFFCLSVDCQVAHLTLGDAFKILGEKAHLTDSTSSTNNEVSVCRITYTADSSDKVTGKTGVIYYMFEEYADVSGAKEVYSKFWKENKEHEGIRKLYTLGDEAYFHSDGENFLYIAVRTGKRMFRMKVNKITSKTSLEEFNNAARNISDSL